VADFSVVFQVLEQFLPKTPSHLVVLKQREKVHGQFFNSSSVIVGRVDIRTFVFMYKCSTVADI
jgi:hypothetical protein